MMKTDITDNNRIRRLAAGSILLLLSLSVFQQANAESDDAFRMMALEDQAAGYLLTRGEFRDAIEKLESDDRGKPTFAAYNNLCVAYTKTMKFEKAAVACDAAVAARTSDKQRAGWYAGLVASTEALDQAVALSNRGVLRAVTGDIDGARADFEAAMASRRGLRATRLNHARLATYVPRAVASTVQHAH